jgi:hypothetical protein
MENLEWKFDQLISVATNTLLAARTRTTPAGIHMTYQIVANVTDALASLPFVKNISEDDREVLRLAMLSFTDKTNHYFNQYAVTKSRYGHLRFNCLVDDDIVLSNHYPLIPN